MSMECLNQIAIATPTGEKYISVNICDIQYLDEEIDILTISAFYRDYNCTPRTLIHALGEKGIYVDSLSRNPEIDLRDVSNIWLSRAVHDTEMPVGRIGCIEMSPYSRNRELWKERTTDIVSSIQAYFRMIDIASLAGIRAETIGLPMIGTGSQQINMNLIIIPLLKECVDYLKQNSQIKEIKILERNPSKAFQIAKALDNSYSMMRESAIANPEPAAPKENLAFISYSSSDKNIADNLCYKLESSGMKAWYAPRDIRYNDYAASIVNGINSCTHFIVILSKNSFKSEHVLNEIDLAFQRMSADARVKFCPLKIDEETMGPAFKYYLCRQHWMDAHVPPIEKRLDEFVHKITGK